MRSLVHHRSTTPYSWLTSHHLPRYCHTVILISMLVSIPSHVRRTLLVFIISHHCLINVFVFYHIGIIRDGFQWLNNLLLPLNGSFDSALLVVSVFFFMQVLLLPIPTPLLVQKLHTAAFWSPTGHPTSNLFPSPLVPESLLFHRRTTGSATWQCNLHPCSRHKRYG